MSDLVGKTIRGYELLEKAGEGGFGEVYRAYQPKLDRFVAIKFIRTDRAKKKEFAKRFDAEARIIAKLEHSHIVPIYDY